MVRPAIDPEPSDRADEILAEEGERALRFEVLGLRSRLDEVGQQNVRLSAELASVASELSIATARFEDRQHEIDHHVDRATQLEKLLAAREGRSDRRRPSIASCSSCLRDSSR